MSIQENSTQNSSSVPVVHARTVAGSSLRNYLGGHNLFMMACCIAMVAGMGILLASAPAGQSLGQKLLLVTPMLGCVGMHLIMHRFMGKSCHSQSKQDTQND